MSTTRGCFGIIKAKAVGATSAASAIGELRSYSQEESSEQIDASAMGTCTKKFQAGAKATALNFTAWWSTATADLQSLLAIGSELSLELYPGGDASGATYYKTGNATGSGAVILNKTIGGEVDGLVELSVGSNVNGEMTATSVP